VIYRNWGLTLWQPWASLWLGPKIHETRGWATKHRGLLYVHAAVRRIRRADMSDELISLCEDEFGGHFWTELPRGHIVGTVRIVDCIPITPEQTLLASPDDRICGNWTPGRFAWRRDPKVSHVGPWPYKGKQGLFRCDDLDAVAYRHMAARA
jgi:activating signal cointegrator 1